MLIATIELPQPDAKIIDAAGLAATPSAAAPVALAGPELTTTIAQRDATLQDLSIGGAIMNPFATTGVTVAQTPALPQLDGDWM